MLARPQRVLGGIRWHGGPSVASDAPTISVTFLQPDGKTKVTVDAKVGESLLQTAHRNDISLEGACEGGKSEVVSHSFDFKLPVNSWVILCPHETSNTFAFFLQSALVLLVI